MDANQTRLHLLLGEADWTRCTGLGGVSMFGQDQSPAVWNPKLKAVTLRPRLAQYVAAKGDVKPRLGSPAGLDGDRRGAGRDGFGNWYFISADRREVLAWSAGSRATSHFWSTNDGGRCVTPSAAGDFQPAETRPPCAARLLSGLAVTADHYLVVGTIDPAGLLVFDLYVAGPPRQLLWPEQVPFIPFDLAARPGGGVWILDRRNRCYWALDRHLRVQTRDQTMAEVAPPQPDLFQPMDEARAHCSQARYFPGGLCLDDASPLADFDPIAIEALPDGSVLILDSEPGAPFCRVMRYFFGALTGEPVEPDGMAKLVELAPNGSFQLRAYDFAFVAQPEANLGKIGLLYFATEEGNQAFGFDLLLHEDQIQLVALQDYLPMRLFSGMGLVAAQGEVFYDSSRRWVPLVDQARPRHALEATLLTPVFDGREPQCVWHRLMLDACLPPDTEVEVWSRTCDEKDETRPGEPLHAVEWQAEPPLHKRGDGSELPFQPKAPSPNQGTFEFLFQRAKGRYLQLQLKLAGNGRVTPQLRALRAYYPRFSYLARYLPAVYREEVVPASFLDRFLANFEGFNTALEDRIVAARALFDVRGAPAEALEWLAAWFGVVLDPAWTELRRRLFIAHAMDYFQWRGTARGLKMVLHLIFDDKPDAIIFAPPGAGCGCSSRSATGTKSCSCGSAADRYRIVEKFLTRRRPGVIFGDPTEAGGLRQTASAGRWRPEMGLAELDARYQAALGQPGAHFSLDVPTDGTAAVARAAFAQQALGFVPSDDAEELVAWRNFLRGVYANPADLKDPRGRALGSVENVALPDGQPATHVLPRDWKAYQQVSPTPAPAVKRRMWQDFLAARYSSVSELNQAHLTHWDSLDTVAYPAALRDGALLADWYQFELVVLPTLEAAHQFTVLLPFAGETAADQESRRERLHLAERLIELEKPAHTTFAVKFYWALFRLGEARLGQDTLLGLGGRDPALLPDAVLGQTYLSETRLVAGPPQNAADRQVLDRDRLLLTRGKCHE